MYNVEISPKKLSGKVVVPPSKSVAHRLLICAALSHEESVITNMLMSKDIKATIESLVSLGAKITVHGDTVTVRGIKSPPPSAIIDCCESGSTLRFVVPVACALGVSAEFHGEGKLPERPITPYISELTKYGISFDYNNTMPFSVSGKLTSGKFCIDGSISSQFVTGLLFSLPLLDGDSEIIFTSRLESKPYVDITIDCLRKSGIEILETQNGYFVKGLQKYRSINMAVEGDYSQSAFYYTANLLGSDIEITGLNGESVQGDKKIIEIVEKICYYNKDKKSLSPFDIDASDIPDLVPILTVLASFCDGTSYLRNVSRLRIKESNRLEAIAGCLNSLGGNVREIGDNLEITGVESLSGGTVSSFNDHRITMSMAVAATRCKNKLLILNANCVEKSYPNFFSHYSQLGGIVNVINLEP